jgi:hypothetical protein
VLAIERRCKFHPAAAAGPGDFVLREVGSLDPLRLVEDDGLSLYSVDPVQRAALFVRTPPQLDLFRAPFLWHAQYTEATEVISVPFGDLADLAARAPMSLDRLVLIHSTGRCGSTLVSMALAEASDVAALSEPDVFIQLQQMRDRGDPEVDSILEACTRLLFAPRAARTCVVKLRSQNIELADLLLRCFPSAKTVFVYRQVDSWARSAVRAFGLFGELLAIWDHLGDLQPRVRSLVDGEELCPFPSPIEFLGWMYATPMLRATILQRQGIPLFMARYEELNDRPLEVLTALCEFCDLEISTDALEGVIARDSQEGTEHSRRRVLEPGSELTDERLALLRAHLAKLAPTLDPDSPLDGTYGT